MRDHRHRHDPDRKTMFINVRTRARTAARPPRPVPGRQPDRRHRHQAPAFGHRRHHPHRRRPDRHPDPFRRCAHLTAGSPSIPRVSGSVRSFYPAREAGSFCKARPQSFQPGQCRGQWPWGGLCRLTRRRRKLLVTGEWDGEPLDDGLREYVRPLPFSRWKSRSRPGG